MKRIAKKITTPDMVHTDTRAPGWRAIQGFFSL